MSDLKMVLVGDTFVGRPDPDSAFVTAQHLLKVADIAFCNLETVVADAKYLAPHDHDHHPRTDEWMFDAYVRAGFNVMNLANNPSTWHGLDCFERCLDVLDKAGIVVHEIMHWEDEPEQRLHLVEAEGFLAAADERLAALQAAALEEIHQVWTIGGYAEPFSEAELARVRVGGGS